MTDLTLTSATYSTTTQKYGTADLNGGFGTAAGVLPTNGTFAYEAWVKRASVPSSNALPMGANYHSWMGATSTGALVGHIGNYNTGNEIVLTSTVNICDGAWHHIALSVDGTGCYLACDGVIVASSASLPTTGESGANPFGVRDFGGATNSGYTWGGEIDEVAVWSTARYKAAYTAPTAAYAGTETGLIHLYHLDSSGADSAASAATGTTILPNNAGLVYSPYTWLVAGSAATTINAGAYLKTLFTGATCVLNFNVAGMGTPATRIWYRIDGYGPWTSVPVAATVTLAMPADTTGYNGHLLEVVIKANPGTVNRWNLGTTPNVAAILTSMTLDSGATVSAPIAKPKNVIVYGDSVTEAYHSISTNSDETIANDAKSSWAFALGDLLNAEIGVVGFQATGLTKGGQGNVPALGSSWNYLWSGQVRSFSPVPDLAIVMHGANDGSTNSTAAWTSWLNAHIAALPTTKIAVLKPFSPSGGRTTQAGFIQAGIAACTTPSLVTYVNQDFMNLSNSADGTHPWGWENLGHIAPAVAAAVQPLITGSISVSPRFRSMLNPFG